MNILVGVVILVVSALAVLRLLRHSRYALYFHWTDIPISAKQWLEMTHQEKAEYLFFTLALGFKYYHEEPAVWMTDNGIEIKETLESAIRATDLSVKTRLNDATFGRLVRIATFDTVKQVLAAVRTGKVPGPKLTGNEWLSWPLDKKQALLADYATFAFMGIGFDKKWRPEDIASGYIDGVDKTAQKRLDDPRLNKFIANFMNEILRGLIAEFKRQQVAK